MNIFFWFAISLFKTCFFVFYRYKVYGIQHPYRGGAIIAPNHASFLDPPLIAAAWSEETHYLARSTLFKRSWANFILRKLNAHPVNGSAQDLSSFKIICQLLNEDKKVVIFPEGVRSSDGQLQPIKTGVAMLALRTKRPIIPTYIHGTFEAWPRSNKWPHISGRVSCVFGKPIFVDSYSNLDKKQAQELLTQELSQSIKRLQIWFEQGAIGDPP